MSEVLETPRATCSACGCRVSLAMDPPWDPELKQGYRCTDCESPFCAVCIKGEKHTYSWKAPCRDDELETWAAAVESYPKVKAQLSAALAKVTELSVVALEAAAMLSETNHGGLSHLRSVSMQMALEAAGVPIPPSCSACPHPARDGLAAKVAELTARVDEEQGRAQEWMETADQRLRRVAKLTAETIRLGEEVVTEREKVARLEAENARLRREVETLTSTGDALFLSTTGAACDPQMATARRSWKDSRRAAVEYLKKEGKDG